MLRAGTTLTLPPALAQGEQWMRCLVKMTRAVWGEVDGEGTIARIVSHQEAFQTFTDWLQRTCSSDVTQLELLRFAAMIEQMPDEEKRPQLLELCGQVPSRTSNFQHASRRYAAGR